MKKKVKWCMLLSLMWGLVASCGANTAAAPTAPLTASGTIRATEINVASELGGRIQDVHVAPGAEVAAGQLLVTMDDTAWRLQLGPAQAAVDVATAEREALAVGARPAEIEAARASLALAEAERDAVEEDWKNAQVQMRNPQALKQRIHETQTQVALTEQQVQFQDAELRNVQYRFDRGKASEWEVRQAKAAHAAAQADLEAARTLLAHLRRLRDWPLPYIAQVNAAQGEYEVAAAGVDVARTELADVQAGPTQEELAVADAKIQQAAAELRALEVKVAKCALTSPLDGVVLEQALRIGELAAPAAPILTLAALQEVQLEVYVPEPRIGQVYHGQTVTITVDSFPDRAFVGEVTHIGDAPEYTPRNVATAEGRRNTFYAVEIHVPNPEQLLKPGMPADARFE